MQFAAFSVWVTYIIQYKTKKIQSTKSRHELGKYSTHAFESKIGRRDQFTISTNDNVIMYLVVSISKRARHPTPSMYSTAAEREGLLMSDAGRKPPMKELL